MFAQSVVKHLWRVQNWKDINSYTQERNPSSAHLRAVARDSLWTLTYVHMCVFTLETAHMCVPLTAATKNLPSQPTWSLTSSHTPKPKTTSEAAMNQAKGNNVSIHWRIWLVSPLLDKLMFRGLLCCEIWSPFVLPLDERFKQRNYLLANFLIYIWRFEQGTRENPGTPQASYPTLALPGWNNLRFLLVKTLIHGSARKNLFIP